MRIFLLSTVVLFLALGCSSVKITDYSQEKPEFDLFQFFNGAAIADGVFQDRSGKVIRRMHVEMQGRIEGRTLIIDEDFTYSDGTKSKRSWKFTKKEDNSLQATAADVVTVDKIETSGFAFNMRYILRLPYGDSTIDVKMNDWMYRLSENQIINKTEMSKFGVRLGEVTLTISKK
jgi:hypothetical protein